MNITGAAATPAVTDPSAALGGAPTKALGKNEFLKMLVAQLKNQDPMNPMDGSQMAAQLAQFSSVEQLIDINKALGDQQTTNTAMANAMNAGAAVGMLGHVVVATGNQVAVTSAGNDAVTVAVGASGGAGTLHILDENGAEVGTRELGHLEAGRQTVALGSAEHGLKPGKYTYALDVKDSAGHAVASQTYTSGRIDGITYSSTGPVLTAGALSIPFGSVVQVAAGN